MLCYASRFGWWRLAPGVVRACLGALALLLAVVGLSLSSPASAAGHASGPNYSYDAVANIAALKTLTPCTDTVPRVAARHEVVATRAVLAASPAGAAVPAQPAAGLSYGQPSDLVAPSGIPRLGSVGDEVAAARAHLGTIPDALEYGPNRAMLDSIGDAVASGRPLTTAERNFLDHELLEASYVGQGMTQEAAHALTHQTVPVASNYSPAVIQQFPDHFSDYYFNYWGISR